MIPVIAQRGTPLEMLRGYANGNNGEWSRFVVLCTKRDSRPRRYADLWICMPVARAWVHTSRVCVGVGVSVGVRGGVGAWGRACLWACLCVPVRACGRACGRGACVPPNAQSGGLFSLPALGSCPRCPCVSGLCSASRQASSSATCFATSARRRWQSALCASCASASRRSSSCAIATRYETFISSPPPPLSSGEGFGFPQGCG